MIPAQLSMLQTGDRFAIVQAFDTPEKLESACDYFLSDIKLIRVQKRLVEFICDQYFIRRQADEIKPIRKFDRLWLICRTEPKIAKSQERVTPEEAEKLFCTRFQEVVEKTVVLLKSTLSLEAIFAYIAEERHLTAERAGHPDADDFGTPRHENCITRISFDVDQGKMPREYQERIFRLVPLGAKQNVVSYPYYYQNVDQVVEQTPVGSLPAIALTVFCVIRHHIAKFEAEVFAGAEVQSPYPRATLIHTKSEQFSAILQCTMPLMKKIREKSIPRNELVESIGTAGFWEFKAMRWKRGSATIIETILASLCEHNGLRLRLDRVKKDGKRLDLESLTLLDCKAFTTFFAGYVEEKDSPREQVSIKRPCH